MSRLSMAGLHLRARQSPLYARRAVQMRREELAVIGSAKSPTRARPRLFNLDLHIGVIADLGAEFRLQGIELTRWSISAHNHLVAGRLPVADPVRWVNQRTWQQIDSNVIDRFQHRYKRFLGGFDGFVCTFSPVFAELFRGLGRPTLVVAATRYEAPYSDRPEDWGRFNAYLRSGVRQGLIHLYANNRGDGDYVSYFTGLDVPVVPSLCERQPPSFTGRSQSRVIQSRDAQLVADIERATANRYRDVRALGVPYRWEDLLDCEEVLVIPQNISTMTLFELATAGVPVAVPSPRWLRELSGGHSQVLGELSFHQLRALDTEGMHANNPANYRSPNYLAWWLQRADFYNPLLMPNVRTVDSVEELIRGATTAEQDRAGLANAVRSRNLRVAEARQDMVKKFVSAL